MTLLVTGCAGFIGSAYCRYVLKHHPEDTIVGLDALTYSGNLSTIADLQESNRFSFHQARIEDEAAVTEIVKANSAAAIINFAAETHNDRSILEDADFLTTNVIGVSKLLKVTRDCGVQRTVHVSTDEVYGTAPHGKFTEDSPLLPNTPYSASKAAGDLQCRAHFKTFGTPVIVTRGGNSYGPFQYPEKLISFFAVRLIQDKKVPLYGDGSQIREWIHVMDHAAGIDCALRRGTPGEIYNISDENERRNSEIAGILLDLLSKPESLIKHIEDPRRGAHDARYSMDSSKLRALGWKPQVNFEQGIRETIAWYDEHESWWKPICDRPEYQQFVARFYGPGLGEDL